MYAEKVLSGMRPTGRLHLGHYHGVLANWIKLQHEYPCLFFVADWHALTTAYDEPGTIAQNAWDMVIDWLAAGVDPSQATLFIQSRVPEHAELHLLGYPLLQAADILIYRANRVPVGEDQVPHIEFTREIARRFNHLYGREPGFADKARESVKKLGSKRAKLYEELRTRYQEKGEDDALEQAHVLLNEAQSLSHGDRERLFGYLEGGGKMILVEPDAMLTEASRMPGLDGQKMSKSYGNTIALREDAESIRKKIRTMQTDPQRVRRTDPGDPEKCPVWQFHLIYSTGEVKTWVQQGCRSAGIGCIECKQPVIDAVLAEQEPMRERARMYEEDPRLVRNIIADGCEKARKLAQETMRDVREAIGLDYT